MTTYIEDQINEERERRANASNGDKNPNPTQIPPGKEEEEDGRGGIKFGMGVAYDDAYQSNDGELVSSLPTLEEERRLLGDDDDYQDVKAREEAEMEDSGRMDGGMHPSTMEGMREMGEEGDSSKDSDLLTNGGTGLVNTRISDRESDYHKRRLNRSVRSDGMSYKDAMVHANLDRDRADLLIEAKKELLDSDGKLLTADSTAKEPTEDTATVETTKRRRRRRWDDSDTNGSKTTAPPTTTTEGESLNNNLAIVSDSESSIANKAVSNKSRWDDDTATNSTIRRRKRWDETPVTVQGGVGADATPLMTKSAVSDATPLITGNNWGETPIIGSAAAPSAETLLGGRKRSRWDSTPAPTATSSSAIATPLLAGIIPVMTGDLTRALSLEREMETRNRPWTNAALDSILPSEGFTTLSPPSNYLPLRTPSRKLLATPTPLGGSQADGFQMAVPPEELTEEGRSINDIREAYGVPIAATSNDGAPGSTSLPYIKPEDMQYFGRLLNETDDASSDSQMTKEQESELKIMTLLLKIKSGTPPQRKTAMRQITDRARFFGAAPLFNQILPLLSSPTLEDQERHLLVKVIDRVLYKLDDLVRPYTHRILAAIEPLLIDEDYYARVEGREIIGNLAKAAGLPTMISTMRPDVDDPDEYVRNITSRAFAVVASALGLSSLLPFLRAVCQSRKSWRARHTGIKIVQQIAVLIGCAVLPYLRELVDCIAGGLMDEQGKVRIMAALTVAALAEASHPYGIESFDPIVRPLWTGALEHQGKALAAFLKAVGFVIPLMEENYASQSTRIVMPILLKEFHSPDEEMKKIVLKVVKQCVSTAGVEPDYIREEILPEFFRHFWIRRMALDRRNHNQVVETTVELANKVGSSDVISRIVDDLKDDSEPYRRMVMETVRQVLENLGSGDVGDRLEERLIDGILYAFQEQAVDASLTGNNAFGKEGQVMLDGFGTVVNALGERCKPYLKQIAGTIKWRLNNKAPSVRMQASDLIGRIAVVMKACGEDSLMGHLGVVLYEYLGEEYPEVLGSILGALRAIVNVIGMTKMTPPIRDLLPRLTPILRNRHEKVQENCIDLVGRIGDRGAEFVSAKEWMRICFELLEMLKAHKQAIRRAAVSTFGYIAKAIGPQDVLHTLLNNLKVQDRQMRVCTTVAIAIVAESCGPFTVLPAVMNEYRVPELNIQNGVLKALSFMFEYIGDMAKDYIYAVAPLLADALMDRDPVHRQTGCATVKHLSLGVAGLGCEDVLMHLLNYVWPNIFEESPHVIQAVLDAVQGLTVSLGPNVILQYALQGLYHPARKIREIYWKIYNLLYIYAADALVMGYPMISSVNNVTENATPEYLNNYERTTLELFI